MAERYGRGNRAVGHSKGGKMKKGSKQPDSLKAIDSQLSNFSLLKRGGKR